MSDWFQVRGVHALGYSAEMVQFQSISDRSGLHNVGETVREDILLENGVSKYPVSVRCGGARPQPARFRPTDLGPESLRVGPFKGEQRYRLQSRHGVSYRGAAPPATCNGAGVTSLYQSEVGL